VSIKSIYIVSQEVVHLLLFVEMRRSSLSPRSLDMIPGMRPDEYMSLSPESYTKNSKLSPSHKMASIGTQ
jgi:hypothetical protein